MDDERAVTITYPDHYRTFVDGMANLLTEKRGVDMEVNCRGHAVRVHRLVMSLFVPGVQLSYGSEDSDPKTRLLDLDHVIEDGGEDLDRLVELVYLGRVSVPHSRLDSMLQTAKALGVHAVADALKQLCWTSQKAGPRTRRRTIEIAADKCSKDVVFQNSVGASVVSTGRRRMAGPELMDCQLSSDGIGAENEERDRIGGRRTRKKRASVKPSLKSSETVDEDIVTKNPSVGQLEPRIAHNEDEKDSTNELQSEDDEENDCLDGDSECETEGTNRMVPSAELARKMSPRNGGSGTPTRAARKTRRGSPNSVGRGLPVSSNEYKRMWRQNQPLLSCEHCTYKTRDKVTFRSHAAKHDPSASRPFQCQFCHKSFRSKKGFVMHEQSHRGLSESFPCPHCPFRTSHRGSLSRHVTGVHQLDGKGRPLQPVRRHACPQCEFTCQYRSLLKLHQMRKHSADKPWKCAEAGCGHACVLRSDLDKHVAIVHHKLRSHMCETCGYRSTHSGALNRHRRSHTGEKPFRCQLCGQTYADGHKLKGHLQRHLGDEKPYVCHLCGHACRRRDNLQMHVRRIHKATLDNELVPP